MEPIEMIRRDFLTKGSAALFALRFTPEILWNTFQDISREELLGKGNPQLITKSGYLLRPEAAKAFDQMMDAAAEAGVPIQVVSSYRSFDHQNRIWKRKYNSYSAKGLSPQKAIDKIIEYSTLPGTSRHHWGTDVDIIQAGTYVKGDVLVPSKFHGTGPFCELKMWLDEHAKNFDFHLVYTDIYGRKGFNYEPWHYSYAPLSVAYLNAYQKLNLSDIFQKENLLGSSNFSEAFLKQYRNENILDINPELLV
ncbi:MAG: M15 family metallopeptidase [Leeuwenhoekiella sp.]